MPTIARAKRRRKRNERGDTSMMMMMMIKIIRTMIVTIQTVTAVVPTVLRPPPHRRENDGDGNDTKGNARKSITNDDDERATLPSLSTTTKGIEKNARNIGKRNTKRRKSGVTNRRRMTKKIPTKSIIV